MSKKMLIDAAHPEEVRVAVVSQNKIEDFDFESAARKPLRGNIFLARVTRVEPSLQAAFVDYGGNRHGFLAFSEIHPDYYQIPVSDRNELQDAEQEVAELAAELELSQRGDDEDDEDHQDSDMAPDDEREEPDESFAESLSSDEGDDATVSANGDADADDASLEDQPIERRDTEEEEEEEEDGETDDETSTTQGGDDDASDEVSAASEDLEQGSEDDGSPLKAAEARPEDVAEETPSDGSEDDDAEASSDNAEARHDASDDSAGDDTESSEADAETTADGKSDTSKSARAARNALFERYKNAKRKRAQLLRNYKIQEVIKRRQILLIQVVKEERGNKGAALTTYLSLAGRYCVLMPNTARGGGISRKIANGSDRRRLRRVVDSLDVPRGMGLIIRTAGAKRTKTEIKRDYDYLLRLWENIRSLTLKSIAPCLIYEEASLIKRAIRDLYDKDISKVYVEGEEGYREAKDFMKMLMPSHAKNVQPYKDRAPILLKHGVETQLDGMYQPSVRLKSGGYIVIHQTEALVAIDVNSGRATRERNIEQTALKTNVEAAEEAARQFRLRDLAGLIVIDFIDMEEPRNNRKVERALKDAMKADRARVQIGRISPFGLLELSRQRRRSGIVDGTTQACPTCSGAGVIRSHNMAALRILRAIEGEAISGRVGTVSARTSIDVSLHVLNHHRDWINRIEQANGVSVEIVADSDKHGDDYDLESSGAPRERRNDQPVIRADQTEPIEADEKEEEDSIEQSADAEDKPKKRRRRRRSRRDREDAETRSEAAEADDGEDGSDTDAKTASDDESEDKPKKRRRRGRRGGRRNRKETVDADSTISAADGNGDDAQPQNAPPAGVDDVAPEQSVDNGEAVETTEGEPLSVEATADNDGDSPPAAAPANGADKSDDNADMRADEVVEASTGKKADEAEAGSEDDAPAPARKPARRGWWRQSAS